MFSNMGNLVPLLVAGSMMTSNLRFLWICVLKTYYNQYVAKAEENQLEFFMYLDITDQKRTKYLANMLGSYKRSNY